MGLTGTEGYFYPPTAERCPRPSPLPQTHSRSCDPGLNNGQSFGCQVLERQLRIKPRKNTTF
jgi:hypothetical protein